MADETAPKTTPSTKTESTATVDVDADVEQTGTTNREVNIERETEVDIHWWGADVDDAQGAPVRIGREDRELKFAGES